MSLQRIEQVFRGLDRCTVWSLQLLKGRSVRGEFVYNAHDIVITTPNAIIEFIKELSFLYTKEKGKLSEYNMVCNYDGSTIGNRIYKLELSNELIKESCEKLKDAMGNPDMQGNAIEFRADSYVLSGSILIDGTSVAVQLFTVINPFKLFKHAFGWDGNSFKSMPDKYLSLRRYVDVIIIGDTAYLFNMNGEKLFNMERAYKTICCDKVESIIESGIVSDEDMFKQYATSGHNPRKFVAFDETRLQKIRCDEDFKNRIAGKFGISLTSEGVFDSTDSENVNKLVKFLCKKGMIDPVNEDAVEVEGVRQWM